MRNIFKTFKENKVLLEENKRLKAQNEALMSFKGNFDNYYRNISGIKMIPVTYDNKIVLSGSYRLDDVSMHYPIAMIKEHIAKDMAKNILPLIEFDIVDNVDYGTRDFVGRIVILTKQ